MLKLLIVIMGFLNLQILRFIRMNHSEWCLTGFPFSSQPHPRKFHYKYHPCFASSVALNKLAVCLQVRQHVFVALFPTFRKEVSCSLNTHPSPFFPSLPPEL